MKKIKTSVYNRWKKSKKPNVNIVGWPHIRKAILDRDNFVCRICGDDYDLEVHHIDYIRSNNQSTNLVTLCQPCHHALHQERYKPWEHPDWPAPWGEIEPNPQKPS